MVKFDDADGVWRTIGGRRVFIRNGQDLASAMIESGKFKKGGMRAAYRKEKEKEQEEEKKKKEQEETKQIGKTQNISSNDAVDEFMNADNGDWNNMNQSQRDEQCEKILNNFEKKYGDKLKDEKFRQEVLDGLEDQNFHTMGKIIEQKYENNNAQELKNIENKIKEAQVEKEEMEYALYKMGHENPNEIDPMTENSTDWEELDKKFKDRYEKEKQQTFTQKTDMYGGTREYSKEELDRMEEHGAKPMEHSYTGGGWEGTKYDSNLSTKDIAKNISDYAKDEFPDVKLSRKTDYNGIDINIMSSEKDLYKSSSDIDNMSNEQISATIRDSVGGYSRFDDWLNDNNKKSANGTYTVNEQKEYLKNELQTYKNRKGDRVTGSEWYLSDYGQKVVSGLNKEMNSYNFDDSDGMVDYFHTNFYGYVQIGKWDKPYEVTSKQTSGNQITNSLRQKAYNKYMKEHPGSEMSFEDFLKKQ